MQAQADGAAAIVLMTAEAAQQLGCTPLARIVGYADGASDPIVFPIPPKFDTELIFLPFFEYKVGLGGKLNIDIYCDIQVILRIC